MAYYDKLRAEVPPGLVELLRIPGLGPKTVRQLYAELGIETIDDLRQAAEAGRCGRSRACPRKTEQLVLEGIERLESRPQRRMLLDRAAELVDGGSWPRSPTMPGVRPIEPAGSFRRRKETIGDLDLLAETDGRAGAHRARSRPSARSTTSSTRAATRRPCELLRGPQVDLMVMPPGEAGTYRIHFTGSKEHNVRLRARARDQGWSLSEKGFLRIGEDGEPLTGDDAELRTFATEAEAYAFLGLPFIEPELREDAGEIEAALAGTPAAADHPGRPARRPAQPLRLVRRRARRSRSWPRPPGAAATPTRS